MENNIYKCQKCGLSIIQEELSFHQCKKLKADRYFFDTDDDFVSIFDGFRWIRINSNRQPMGNTNKTTDNETEP